MGNKNRAIEKKKITGHLTCCPKTKRRTSTKNKKQAF
jgi:hypothetical protein